MAGQIIIKKKATKNTSLKPAQQKNITVTPSSGSGKAAAGTPFAVANNNVLKLHMVTLKQMEDLMIMTSEGDVRFSIATDQQNYYLSFSSDSPQEIAGEVIEDDAVVMYDEEEIFKEEVITFPTGWTITGVFIEGVDGDLLNEGDAWRLAEIKRSIKHIDFSPLAKESTSEEILYAQHHPTVVYSATGNTRPLAFDGYEKIGGTWYMRVVGVEGAIAGYTFYTYTNPTIYSGSGTPDDSSKIYTKNGDSVSPAGNLIRGLEYATESSDAATDIKDFFGIVKDGDTVKVVTEDGGEEVVEPVELATEQEVKDINDDVMGALYGYGKVTVTIHSLMRTGAETTQDLASVIYVDPEKTWAENGFPTLYDDEGTVIDTTTNPSEGDEVYLYQITQNS